MKNKCIISKMILSILICNLLSPLPTFASKAPITYGNNTKSHMDEYQKSDSSNSNSSDSQSSNNESTSTTNDKTPSNSSSDNDTGLEQDPPSNNNENNNNSSSNNNSDSSSKNDKTPYEKTSIIEKVPVYKNGSVVRYISLKKTVKAIYKEQNGIKGKQVTIYKEYVKYWKTTDTYKIPVIDSKTTSEFMQEDENHKIDLDSL